MGVPEKWINHRKRANWGSRYGASTSAPFSTFTLGAGFPFLFAWLDAELPDEEPNIIGTLVGGVICIGICFAIIVVIEVIASSLRRHSFKGWIAGLILFDVYAFSLFLPLGVVGLWALLSRGTREQFGIAVSTPVPNQEF